MTSKCTRRYLIQITVFSTSSFFFYIFYRVHGFCQNTIGIFGGYGMVGMLIKSEIWIFDRSPFSSNPSLHFASFLPMTEHTKWGDLFFLLAFYLTRFYRMLFRSSQIQWAIMWSRLLTIFLFQFSLDKQYMWDEMTTYVHCVLLDAQQFWFLNYVNNIKLYISTY